MKYIIKLLIFLFIIFINLFLIQNKQKYNSIDKTISDNNDLKKILSIKQNNFLQNITIDSKDNTVSKIQSSQLSEDLQKMINLNNIDNYNRNFFFQIDNSTKLEYLKNKIMAHRGLFGYFPEHSIKGFELAYYMGADYLETDINLTKDGKMIIFHDPILDTVTNIAEFPQYLKRKKTKYIDGILYENSYFITDFTYEEISQFYLTQRFKNRPQIYNKEFKILLMEDLIRMVIKLNVIHNKKTGIYIEPKYPQFFKEELNLNISEELIQILTLYNLTDVYHKKTDYEKCPIVIQAFELETLKFFREKASLPQISLMSWRFFYNYKEIAKFADGIGPDINYILYERIDDLLIANKTSFRNKDDYIANVVGKVFEDELDVLGNLILPSKNNLFLEYAKKLNLIVHPYNMNNDNPKFSLRPEIQYCKMKKLGVDGFFADFCDTAILSLKNAESLCSEF